MIYGTIVEVSTTNIGENLTAAASAAATTIFVTDATTFKELGGQLQLSGEVYVYTGIDPVANSITLLTGLAAAAFEDDRVEVYPLEPVKRASIDLGIPEGESISVIVPHALAAAVGDGMREEANRETALLQERGVGEVFLADVISSPATLQSSSFVEGTAGWVLDAEASQIENLNVVQELGADTITAQSIFLDGQDLSVEGVGTLAKGVIAWDSKIAGTGTAAITTTETKLFEFSAGQMFANRLYRLTVQSFLNGSVAGDRFTFRVRYTLDGSAPTISSTVLRSYDVVLDSNTTAMLDYSKVFNIASDTENFRAALCLVRATGTGNCAIEFGRSLDVDVTDLGSYESAAAAGTLSQKSYADATPADADPVRTFTKTWWATWTRTYASDNDIDPGDPLELYQGYYSSDHGNHKSLIGFDYSAIQAALSGATIKSVKFTYRVKHTWAIAGATIYVSSHSYTSKPSTWSSGSVNQDEYHSSGNKEGSTYTKTLPNSVGTAFKNGTVRGLGFGPAPNNSASSYYCYMYGGSTISSRPRLTIVYEK